MDDIVTEPHASAAMAAPTAPEPVDVRNRELARRSPRERDPAAENSLLRRLSRTLTVAPAVMFRTLVDGLIEVCRAGSAGVSLLESNPADSSRTQFRWVATAGGLSPFLGKTMPIDTSPCGATLDAGAALLLVDPARHFDHIAALPLPIHEILSIPFHREGKAIGTVWVAAHDPERRFDLEDVRLMMNASQFAAAATHVLNRAAASDRTHAAARVAAATELADLTESHRRLTVAEQERGEFLATLTHELRNVAAPLLAALKVIERSEARAARTKARQMMERQVRQLNRLIDDLLDTSRLATGKLRLDLEVVDVFESIRNAVTTARERIEGSGQSIALFVPDDRSLVLADAVRLAQVFSNLLISAAKYGRSGGVVTITATPSASAVVVSIKDTGAGIDAKMLSRIFDLFVQVDASLTQSDGGLGIGLALVKQLIELHGGRVEARSEGLGRGSEFLVYLPITEACA